MPLRPTTRNVEDIARRMTQKRAGTLRYPSRSKVQYTTGVARPGLRVLAIPRPLLLACKVHVNSVIRERPRSAGNHEVLKEFPKWELFYTELT